MRSDELAVRAAIPVRAACATAILQRCLRRRHLRREARRVDTREQVRRGVLLDARLVPAGIHLAVSRPAELRQHPVRQRAGPLGRRRVIQDRATLPGRGCHVPALAVLVEPHLADPVEVGRELVPRGCLVGQPQQAGGQPIVVQSRAAVPLEAVEHDQVGRPVAQRAEEPQLVPHDRATQRHVEVIDPVDPGRAVPGVSLFARGHAEVAQPRVPHARLPVAMRPAEERRPAEVVSAILRDHVDPDAATLRVGAGARRRERGLRVHLRIEVHLVRAVADRRVHLHPVDQGGRVHPTGPVAIHQDLFHRSRAPDVGETRANARHQGAERIQAVARRNCFERLAREHFRSLNLLHVDDRGLARHGDRLFDGADRHHDVEIDRDIRRKLYLVTYLGAKPGQRVGHGVGARP